MKIAHITTADHAIRALLLNQLQSIQAMGFEVVGISAPGNDISHIEAAGVRHIAVPMTRNITPWTDLVALEKLYRIMRREQFTIVHTHTPKASLLGQLAARMAGVPLVVNTLHGFYFHEHMRPAARRFYINIEKVAALCSHSILSQNREDIQTAIAENICRPEKIKFLGNGIDVRRFDRARLSAATLSEMRQSLGLSAEHRVVGFVGRLVREKGIPELLQAAKTILERQPNTRFLIIGPVDKEKPDAFRREHAREFGVADACIFTGMRYDLPELYAQMDVFVLPSHREGFPRSPMEAAAMSVPSVVTNVRGCREAVEPGRNGLMVPLGDVPALANAILTLLENEPMRVQMSAAARVMALERFDEQLVFQTVKDEYVRLLKRSGLSVPEPMLSPAKTVAG